ncbi:MAG: hypothetical protein HY849_01275 [Nitrosomonadales bacterium]|nr:hypothetical protein [Nitrosomonadales bacterium]
MRSTFTILALAISLAASAAEMPLAASAPAAEHAGHASRHTHGWTNYPLIQRSMSKGMDGRGTVLMNASNMQADHLYTYAPSDAVPHELELTMAGAKLEALPKVGNYYWVTAREATPEQVIVASTSYYFSNPGPAPTKMLLSKKHELELIPQPLPREHNSYRAKEKWLFLLRFDGVPLANQPLTLETQNGSTLRFTSDAQGYAEVRFPDDFKPETEEKPVSGEHSHGPRRASFVLATEHHNGSVHYLTSFNASYGPDAYTDRNLALGLGFTLLGMACGAPLLRHKRKASPASDTPQTPTGV